LTTGGREEEFQDFLKSEFGDIRGKEYEKQILQLSIDLKNHLDKLYGFSLNELGIDFAIDDQGNVWMHEVNNGPQTTYSEDKRAIEYIGYAKYIAENGIMHQMHYEKKRILKEGFNAKDSDLKAFIADNKILIGILISDKTNKDLVNKFIHYPTNENISVFAFSSKDIDSDFELIRGSFCLDNKQEQLITNYPTVIIDLLKRRNFNDQPYVYNELGHLIFTNEWDVNQVTNVDFLSQLRRKFPTYILPVKKVEKPLDVFNYLKETKRVLLNIDQMNKDQNKHYITFDENENRYVLFKTNGEKEEIVTENRLRLYIQTLIDNEEYFVQESIDSEQVLEEGTFIAVRKNENHWAILSNQLVNDSFSIIIPKIMNDIEKIYEVGLSEARVNYVISNNKLIIESIEPNGYLNENNYKEYVQYMLDYAVSKVYKT